MNKWSKKNGLANKARVMEELSDVILFLMNFCITWRLTPDEILSSVRKVQANNFQKVKEKKMQLLNDEMLQLPGYTLGIGQGNLSPKYVFIGQNPGQGIQHGYKVFSIPEDGSSQILLPALGDLVPDCYFTNLVKETTHENTEPTKESAKFWVEYLDREISILREGNNGMKVFAMGNWTNNTLLEFGYKVVKISHPSYHLRKGTGSEKYGEEIQKAIAHID